MGVDFSLAIPIPDIMTKQVVLRDSGDDGCSPGQRGYEKSNSPWRRQTFAAQATQAGVGADFTVTINGGTAGIVDLFAGGSQSGTSPGDAATVEGFPVGYGVLTRAETNLYPGGMLCQPEEEFVVRSISARAKPIFELSGATKVYGEWLKGYQAQLQQAVLENCFLTFQYKRETCALDMEILVNYRTSFSSGMQGGATSSQNGETLKGNIDALLKGLPVGSEGGNRANAQLNVNMVSFTERLDAFDPPPSQPATIIVATEIVMYGNCRPYCPVDYANCPPNRGGQPPASRQIPG